MFEKFNERAKKLTAADIILVKWAVLFATIIIVKLVPQLLNINYPVLVVLMLLCSAVPFYKFWIKK
ncbi:MAG: hypothetical protein PHS93_00640 [Candidatus Omnitrophica bacterium]|nr:hypothetical protein [Candidatus Omnitrophota bacterium]MDD5351659.1 hypothetical protein [Candidatus Omnitrophota bacterium]MDD5550869.1 hypothetical protein [Candidatus Omnitrophota bacterium]